MGGHLLHLPHLPLLHHNLRKEDVVPKGCLPVKVGPEGEEEQRFVVPICYFNHPLFLKVLKVAEDEYGFDQKGTLKLPCEVAEFRNVRGLIDGETNMATDHPHHHHHHPHHPHPHNNLLVDCFKA